MISYVAGNIFESDAQALVNTVNLEGLMGKGIALQFKRRFNFLMPAYKAALKRGELSIGRLQFVPFDDHGERRYVINFPTKNRWRTKSQMRFISEGLVDLRHKLIEFGITSVAIPPLGCGNGGLEWELVKTEIEHQLSILEAVDIRVYAPSNYLDAPNTSEPPKLTPVRHLVLSAIEKYEVAYAETTQVEIQKLAYFLKALGSESLKKLHFQQHLYGPFAPKLKFVVEALEGHYINGLKAMDAKAFDPLILDYRAIAEATRDKELLSNDRSALTALKDLIDGFESAYGLELLASVHWVMQHGANTESTVIEAVQSWSPRKKELFPVDHLQLAFRHLSEHGYLFQQTPTLFS